ncbi:MAG: linear amide C-N hydrolase [Desulfobacterales bacterium]|nr:linear amide C-N hydrolase [Desulfobacterales bacterium]
MSTQTKPSEIAGVAAYIRAFTHTELYNNEKRGVKMKRIFYFLMICLFTVITVMVSEGQACSIFGLKGETYCIAGKNNNWFVDDGLLAFNKRQVKKTAFVYYNQNVKKSAAWTSKYGSVTFNQYGCGLPATGMNEKGLVVDGSVLLNGKFPSPDDRPSINPNQWIQYQLDNFATTEEVISHVEDLCIRPKTAGMPGLHYFIWDKKGNCAVVDYIEGRAVVTSGNALTVPLLTNSEYSLSVNSWKKKKITAKDTAKSITRFISAADQISYASPTTTQEARDFTLKVLDSLHYKTPTVWQIIYDPLLSRVYFRTRDKKGLKHADLKNIDFQCHNPMLVLNINETGQGDVSHKIKPYHRDINRDLIKNAFLKSPFIRKVSEQVLDHRSMYPETHQCMGK